MSTQQQVEFGVYVPQLGFDYAQVRDRADACEALGFHSIWFFDHLYGPELPDLPALEGWTLATAVLAQTTRLRVGHLVLSATFRHPALLAKMATTLDVVSGGRLELGLGSGSYRPEHERAAMSWGTLAERTELLAETLEIVTHAFAEESVTTDGPRFPLIDFPVRPRAVQLPRPPIHVGGAGERRTLPLVARYADVWNCPTYALAELDTKRAALARECETIGRDPQSDPPVDRSRDGARGRRREAGRRAGARGAPLPRRRLGTRRGRLHRHARHRDRAHRGAR